MAAAAASRERLGAREHAPGEDVLLDEVGAASVAEEALVRDGDHLETPRGPAGFRHLRS